MQDYRATLRRLALRDDRYLESLQAEDCPAVAESGLDERSRALICVGALVALDAAPPSFMSAAGAALRAGASHEELVGVLIALLPIVGDARVVSAAPNLGLALGYDVGEALESFSSGDTPT